MLPALLYIISKLNRFLVSDRGTVLRVGTPLNCIPKSSVILANHCTAKPRQSLEFQAWITKFMVGNSGLDAVLSVIESENRIQA